MLIDSSYLSMYRYARYYRKKHPNVIENEKVMQVIVDLTEKRFSVRV